MAGVVSASQAKWMALVQGAYLTITGSNCPTCVSPRLCNNYFCVECEVGELCPALFQAEQPHWQHPWIQVVKVTRECAVNEDVLIRFIGQKEIDLVQKYKENQKRACFLRTRAKAVATKVSSLRTVCKGCGYLISHADTPRKGEVCSVECLLTYAERNPDQGLVSLLPSFAMDATRPPNWSKPKSNPATSSRARSHATAVPVDAEPSGETSGNGTGPTSDQSDDSDVQTPSRGVVLRDNPAFSDVPQCNRLDILISVLEITGEFKRVLGPDA